MTQIVLESGLIVVAYLVGAVPFAYVIGRMFGVDLRHIGSGNMGAGNLTKSVGFAPGAAAGILDGLKGLAPILIARYTDLRMGAGALAGIAAVAGHNWSIYFRGRGGRGLATSVGVVVGISPMLILWPGVWSAVGWRIGGGRAGFFGWALLPLIAAVMGAGGTVVAVSLALATFMLIRRGQGNGQPAESRAELMRRLFDDQDFPIEQGDEAEEAAPS